MSQGLKDAGFRLIGAIEIDPAASATYKLNHRGVHVWTEDVTKLSGKEILKTLKLRAGELDLLGGCPPCQGFSTLRTFNGKKRIRDQQNDLIFEFQRLVRELEPKRVMLENVPALMRNKRLRLFKRTLKELGYNVDAKVLNVADYGVPQRRRRVMLLASRVSEISFADPVKIRRTVRDAIYKLPKAGKSGDHLHDLPENRAKKIARRIRAIPRDGGSRNALPKRWKLACHEDSDGFKDVYGRMAWDEPAPTITTGCFNPSKGRFLHPTAHRAITMREAALLQSFPNGYRFPSKFGKVKIAMMIGNALPPAFIKRHASKLLKTSQGNRPARTNR
jgi:DNA (cytosine-5)-methyltransferase 1